MRRRFSVLLPLMLAACSAPGGPFPSLQPRAAEAIDPRVPVNRPMNARAASPDVTSSLAAMVDRARAGQSDFDPLMANAERLAASAGASHSEGWIAAQEALSAAIAAQRTTATAMADIDALGGQRLQTQGGMAPSDQAAIEAAAAEVGTIDQRQHDRILAVQKRLGS